MTKKQIKCSHLYWKRIIGYEPEKGIIENATLGYHIEEGIPLEVTCWCPECGALKINKEWILPRRMVKK